MFFDVIYDNFDLSGLNIIAIADKRFKDGDSYKGFNAIPPSKIAEIKPSLILISMQNPNIIKDFFKNELFKNNTEIKYQELVKLFLQNQ